ncbi:hypothetical protein B0H21DRAFT_712966 [Amylocystis lapponica]|nr:hypothetical protein B0H21DRAFT_712966 [Amylocystis lapponica]
MSREPVYPRLCTSVNLLEIDEMQDGRAPAMRYQGSCQYPEIEWTNATEAQLSDFPDHISPLHMNMRPEGNITSQETGYHWQIPSDNAKSVSNITDLQPMGGRGKPSHGNLSDMLLYSPYMAVAKRDKRVFAESDNPAVRKKYASMLLFHYRTFVHPEPVICEQTIQVVKQSRGKKAQPAVDSHIRAATPKRIPEFVPNLATQRPKSPVKFTASAMTIRSSIIKETYLIDGMQRACYCVRRRILRTEHPFFPDYYPSHGTWIDSIAVLHSSASVMEDVSQTMSGCIENTPRRWRSSREDVHMATHDGETASAAQRMSGGHSLRDITRANALATTDENELHRG